MLRFLFVPLILEKGCRMKQSSSFIAVFQRVFKWLTAFRHTRTIFALAMQSKNCYSELQEQQTE